MTTTQHPSCADMPAIFIGNLMVVPSRGVACGGPVAHFCCRGVASGRRDWRRGRLPSSKQAACPLWSLSRRSWFLVDTSSIAQMIEPSLAAMGYGLVRVAITSGRRATLQIMIERLDDLPITLDDCTQIS